MIPDMSYRVGERNSRLSRCRAFIFLVLRVIPQLPVIRTWIGLPVTGPLSTLIDSSPFSWLFASLSCCLLIAWFLAYRLTYEWINEKIISGVHFTSQLLFCIEDQTLNVVMLRIALMYDCTSSFFMLLGTLAGVSILWFINPIVL